MGQFTHNGVIYRELPDGQVEVIGYEGQQAGPVPLGPRDNSKAVSAANEAERIRLAREAADRAAAAQSLSTTMAGQKNAREIADLNARLFEKGLRLGADGVTPERIPNWTPPASIANKPTLSARERADALAGYTSATQLDSIIAQLESQYKEGPGATRGVYGLKDYFGTTANQQFDKTGNAARGIVGTAMGFTGGQLNTAAEAEAAVGPYLPQSGDRDSVILDKIQRLKELRDLARQRSVAILGGVPDANGNVTPVPVGQNAMDQAFVQGGNGVQALPAGAQNAVQQLPEPMRQEYAAYVAQNAGRIDPAAYTAFRNQLNAKYNFASDGSDYAKEAATLNDYYAKGGRTFGNIPDQSKTLSTREWLNNTAANNPVGAAFAGAGNIGGIIEGLQPEKYAALREAQGLPLLAGEIGGSIIGTKALGVIGGANRISSPFLRNLATDTVYGGIYGQNTQGDPLSGAVFAAGGSALGQGLSSTLGRIAGGIAESPAAAYLRSRGMQGMTVGQRIGGFAKGVEDAGTSILGVGDMIGRRQAEGYHSLNRLAFDEAGSPVGARTASIGEQGVNDLKRQVGQSFDQTTAGVNGPLDPIFNADWQGVQAAANQLPPDYLARFNQVVENRVQPVIDAGQMSGNDYQQAFRALKTKRAGAAGAAPGFEDEYRNAITAAMDALTGQVQRAGGQSVIDGLKNANSAWRNVKTLERAVKAARNGGRSGEVQLFAPSHLVDAGWESASKYGGARPFAELADNAQRALPSKLPDSGTAKRIALQIGATTALGGAGAGADYYTGGGMDNTGYGLGLAALLAAGGTRTGQRALNTLLFEQRPAAIRDFGELLLSGQRKGLFGAGAAGGALAYFRHQLER